MSRVVSLFSGLVVTVSMLWTGLPGQGSLAQAQVEFRSVTPGQAPSRQTVTPAPGKATPVSDTSQAAEPADFQAVKAPVTRVTKGDGVLPNGHGQKLLRYDISPYTSRVTTTERPEQAIVDWILRETGTEVWFSEPVGLMTATRDELLVYHTAEMHKIVREIVDRFVSSQAETHAFTLRLITIENPNWRSKALPLMKNVSVQSPGVDAWLVSKENAAILINELRKRTDFREHNSPDLVIHNGQSHSIAKQRPQQYVRTVHLRDNAFPAYEVEMGQIQEGYSLQISPLLSMDENTVDAVIKCNIDQIEKLVPVAIDVPSVGGQRQAVKVQVPQVVSWRLHERFRWPTDQVLLLSCGVIANPSEEQATLFGIPNVPNLLATSRGRADALLFIESRGKASQTLLGPARTATAPNYRGRY